MEELIKKVAEAFRDYVLKSPEMESLIRREVETRLDRITELDETVRIAVDKRFDDVDWDSIITDNLDTSSNVFESGVKDVVRDMRFRVEVD